LSVSQSKNRTYIARETRWVSEYVSRFYPDDFNAGRAAFQVPLGPMSTAISRRAAPRADAVVVSLDHVTIIEADAENKTSAIGQLLYYDFVFPLTEAYIKYSNLPRVKVLLVESTDDTFTAFSEKFGLKVDTWAPDWLLSYLISKGG